MHPSPHPQHAPSPQRLCLLQCGLRCSVTLSSRRCVAASSLVSLMSRPSGGSTFDPPSLTSLPPVTVAIVSIPAVARSEHASAIVWLRAEGFEFVNDRVMQYSFPGGHPHLRAKMEDVRRCYLALKDKLTAALKVHQQEIVEHMYGRIQRNEEQQRVAAAAFHDDLAVLSRQDQHTYKLLSALLDVEIA